MNGCRRRSQSSRQRKLNVSRKGSSKAITLGDGKVLAGSGQGWVPQFSLGEPSPGNTLSGRQNGTESPDAGIIISQSLTEPMRLHRG